MDKGQEQWEKLIKLPQAREEDSVIAQRAIEEITRQQAQPKQKKNWFMRKWKYLVACGATFALALCVGLPIYLNKPSAPQIVYYAQRDVIYEDVESAEKFVSENALSIRYFSGEAMGTSQSAKIVATGELAFLTQNVMYTTDIGFDTINFWVVVKKNAEFNFQERYKVMENSRVIKDLTVEYQMAERTETRDTQVLAKFTYQNTDYFLDIVTEGDGAQQLETYVNMLLG